MMLNRDDDDSNVANDEEDDIDNINLDESLHQIMPLKRVKLEHSEFEKKRSLSNFYDVFLCDARIIHLMPEILGKHFIGRKK